MQGIVYCGQKNHKMEVKSMIYHVSASAAPGGDGSESRPFRTIQAAADLALPGDEVLVAPGIYREWVNVMNTAVG